MWCDKQMVLDHNPAAPFGVRAMFGLPINQQAAVITQCFRNICAQITAAMSGLSCVHWHVVVHMRVFEPREVDCMTEVQGLCRAL